MLDIEKLLKHENIKCHVVTIGPGALGFVYRSRKGHYHIFLSESMSPQGKLEVLLHEMHHIKSDIPYKPYVIGLDMQREVFEGQADIFAREMMASYIF